MFGLEQKFKMTNDLDILILSWTQTVNLLHLERIHEFGEPNRTVGSSNS